MRFNIPRVLAATLGCVVGLSAIAQSVSVGVQWQSRDIRHFDARDRHHWNSGRWHQGHHDGRYGWWWIVGGAWYFYPQPVYPYPDPYRPPIIVEQVPTQPIIVQVPTPVPAQPVAPAPAPAPAAQQQFWYYCDAAQGYYPYVATCPSGWRTVPAQPQGVSK